MKKFIIVSALLFSASPAFAQSSQYNAGTINFINTSGGSLAFQGTISSQNGPSSQFSIPCIPFQQPNNFQETYVGGYTYATLTLQSAACTNGQISGTFNTIGMINNNFTTTGYNGSTEEYSNYAYEVKCTAGNGCKISDPGLLVSTSSAPLGTTRRK